MLKLVVTEKPSVAKSIAAVLGANERKDGYLEGNGYLVSWCVGHLVELAQPESYGEMWKKWSYESLPVMPQNWQYQVKDDTKDQYDVLYSLLHDSRVDSVVCATDAGREGELIFRLVYEMAGCNKPMERLWISSMEESAIRDGFSNLRPGREYDSLYQSALCRQEADWLVGINGTRLFTVLYGGKVLKVGRVQTPTLAMLVEREEKIRNFQKEQYYIAHIGADDLDAVTERMDSKGAAEGIVSKCQGADAVVTSVIKEKKSTAPPKLYDLTTLQREANRLFGFTAKQTLEYTQSLYEKKLVTYPRTDSQYLSDDMGETARSVVAAVLDTIPFVSGMELVPDVGKVMNSKKVTDHHAIIPTVELAKMDINSLPEGERKILFLTADRLLCATADRQYAETVKAEISCNGHTFTASGKTILDYGFKVFEDALKKYYKTTEEKENTEKNLPELYEGMKMTGVQAKVTKHFTNPPKHFSEDTLLLAMERAGAEDTDAEAERKGLGTPATRADIIEKLVKDGFVTREKKQMLPTDDGVKLITVLPDVVKSPKLTADWENTLTIIAKGETSAEDFMESIEAMINDLVVTYHSVSEDSKKMFAPTHEAMGKCPKCGANVLKGKYGAYCTGKCGMNVGRAMGSVLNDTQVKDLLAGKKTLVRGLKGKSGKSYDAYLIPEEIEDYSYMKDGKKVSGSQYKFKMEFPKKRK